MIGLIKKYLIHYRMLKFYVRHGMVVEKLMNLFTLNKVNDWENELVSILKNETELKLNLRKTFLNYL